MQGLSLEEYMQSTSSHINQSILYKAGAGAGKTTNLIQQIQNYAIEFYQEYQKWPRVVVTTFTRKATQELKERLTIQTLQKIEDQVSSSNESQYKAFLKDFLFSNHIYISTIDGLLSHFLKQYAFDIEHDPQFQMIDQTANDQYASRIVRKLLKENSEFQKLFDQNTFDQLKELCLKYRSSFYTVEKLKPVSFEDLIDISTHKIKSYWNILNQIESDLVKEKADRINKCFQSLDRGHLDNISHNYKELLDAFERININKIKLKKELKEQFNESLKDCKSFFKNKHFYQISYLREFANYFSLFDQFAVKFIQDFEGIKSDEGLMSIDDLTFLTIKILRDKPQIIKSFSEEWDYWLIDEYQDTTPLQAKILDGFRGSSKEFIVGDPQQSIYLFRGARSEVFENKKATIKNIQYLNTNYRAHPSLVYFFNDFFKNMDQEFLEMTPKDSDITTDPVATFICYREQQKDDHSDNKIIDKNENHDDAVIAEVISLLNEGASYSDICVIGRTNDSLSRIAYKLSQKNIPYQLFSANKNPLQQIRQLNAILKFLLNPYDDINFIELITAPWMRISRSNLYELVQSKENKIDSLWQTLLSSKNSQLNEVKIKLESLLLDVHRIGVTETLKKACMKMGMIEFCKVYDPSGILEGHIWKYFAKLQHEEKKPDFNYLKFVSNIVDPSDLEPDSLPSLEANQLQLMTVHKSKGLEFQHVLIPHLNDTFKFQGDSFYTLKKGSYHLWETTLKFEEGSKKHSLVGDLAAKERKQREKKESDRLLYVAMTRAKKSVHLFCSDQSENKDTSWQGRSACHLWIEGQKGKQSRTHYSYEVKDFDGKMAQLRTQQETILPQVNKRLQIQKSYIRRMSVSDLLEKTSIESKQADYKNQTQAEVLQYVTKIDLGNCYHKVLQTICLNSYLIEKSAKDIINEYFPYVFQEDKKEQIIQSLDFLLSLKEPPMKEVLMKGYAEWPFLHQKGEEVIEGKIDLWAKVDDTIWVIDYKTGRKSNDKKVFQQLSLYGQALAERYKQKMKLVAIYLLEQDVMIYDQV